MHGPTRSFWLQFQDPTRHAALGEKVQQLGELSKFVRPAMEEIFKVLSPGESLPDNSFDLLRSLQEVHAWIVAWKASAPRKGVCQAWGILQMHYPKLNIHPIAMVGPKGPDGMKIVPNGNFEHVMPFARMF